MLCSVLSVINIWSGHHVMHIYRYKVDFVHSRFKLTSLAYETDHYVEE